MANKAAAVPDAWDDDWEAQADAEEEGGVKLSQLQEEHKLSKAEILARHKEENKKMWQSAYALLPCNSHLNPFNQSLPAPMRLYAEKIRTNRAIGKRPNPSTSSPPKTPFL
jgi:hypothetical protein